MDVADAVGREVLLSSLGLGSRDTAAQSGLEQSLLADRAQLNTLGSSWGRDPEVVASSEKIRSEEAYVQGYQDRLHDCLATLQQPAWPLVGGAWPARSSARSAREADAPGPIRGKPQRGDRRERATGQGRNPRGDVKRLSGHERPVDEPDCLPGPETERQEVHVTVIAIPRSGKSPFRPYWASSPRSPWRAVHVGLTLGPPPRRLGRPFPLPRRDPEPVERSRALRRAENHNG